jgi:glycosidase
LEQALHHGDAYQTELALKRIHLLHAMLFSSRGIPFIYSGDEIATLNDRSYKNDPKKQHDSRWIHRSAFDWTSADKRNDASTIQGQVFQTLQQLIAARKANTILHSSVKERYPDAMNPHVFVTTRSEGERVFIGLFNVSDSPQYIAPTTLFPEETKKEFQDIFQQRRVPLNVQSMVLGPYEYYWLISQ